MVDARFGRAAWLLVYDTVTDRWEALDNSANVDAAHGAGISAAEMVARSGAQVLLTGACGPKALDALSRANIQVIEGQEGTVREAVQRFLASMDQANAPEQDATAQDYGQEARERREAMPGMDGTGPFGDGRPGRGLGPCGRGMAYGRGAGRGMGRGRGRGLGLGPVWTRDADVSDQTVSPVAAALDALRKQVESLKAALDELRARPEDKG